MAVEPISKKTKTENYFKSELPEATQSKIIDYQIKLESGHDPMTTSRLMLELGSLYLTEGHLSNAYEYLNKGLKKSSKIKWNEGQAIAYGELARLFHLTNERELERKYLEKSISMSSKLSKELIDVRYRIALNFEERKELLKAIIEYENLIDLCSQDGYQDQLELFNLELIHIYVLLGEYEKGNAFFEASKTSLNEETDNLVTELNDLYLLHYYVVIQDVEKATDVLGRINFQQLNTVRLKSKYYRILYQLFKLKGDANTSLQFLEKYNQILSDKQNQWDLNRVKLESYRLEDLEKNNWGELLNRDEELTGLQQRSYRLERSQIKILIFTTFGVLMVLFGFIWWQKEINKKRAQLNALLKEKNKQLSALHLKVVEQKSELKNSDQFKSKLLAIISHDSRSPLNHILSLLPLMENGLVNKDELAYLTRNIKTKLTDTLNFMDNLLGWTSTQIKGIELKSELFDLKYMVKESTQVLLPQAEGKGVVIINRIESGVIVHADRNSIMLVLRNLISNSIKFCKKDDQIELTYEDREREIVFCLKDSGIGMSKEQLKHLFGSEITSKIGTEKETGFGLGTWLCKEFVERNGGEIWAESEPGVGTTIYFTIQRAMEEELV